MPSEMSQAWRDESFFSAFFWCIARLNRQSLKEIMAVFLTKTWNNFKSTHVSQIFHSLLQLSWSCTISLLLQSYSKLCLSSLNSSTVCAFADTWYRTRFYCSYVEMCFLCSQTRLECLHKWNESAWMPEFCIIHYELKSIFKIRHQLLSNVCWYMKFQSHFTASTA